MLLYLARVAGSMVGSVLVWVGLYDMLDLGIPDDYKEQQGLALDLLFLSVGFVGLFLFNAGMLLSPCLKSLPDQVCVLFMLKTYVSFDLRRQAPGFPTYYQVMNTGKTAQTIRAL